MSSNRRQADARPLVAIIENSETPCRAALHRRFATELPQINFRVIYTHSVASQPWDHLDSDSEITVSFGEGDNGDAPMTVRRVVRDFRKAGRVIAWLERERVAAVVLSGYSDLGRLRLFRWCRRRRIPVFLCADSNARCDQARGIRRIAKNVIVRSVVRCCSSILVFGSEGARYYHRYGGTDDQIVYCPAEPDYRLIEGVSTEDVRRVASQFDLGERRPRFMFCGRLEPEKRPDLAVRAFLRIAPEAPDWQLLIAGDGSLRAECERLVPPDLADRVRFLGFVQSPEALAGLYHLCDVLVVPSDSEAWGLVINEAMAAGLGVIASHIVGAIPELVYPGMNGLIFHRGDVAGLADAMHAVVRTPDVLEHMRVFSPMILRHWRQRGDPVVGLQRALGRAGLIQPAARIAMSPAAFGRRVERDAGSNGPPRDFAEPVTRTPVCLKNVG